MSENKLYSYLKKRLQLKETDFSKLDNNKLYKVGLILCFNHKNSFGANFYDAIPTIYYDTNNTSEEIKNTTCINNDNIKIIYNTLYDITENAFNRLDDIKIEYLFDNNYILSFISQNLKFYINKDLYNKNEVIIDHYFDYFSYEATVRHLDLTKGSKGDYEDKDTILPYKLIFIPINGLEFTGGEISSNSPIPIPMHPQDKFKIYTDKIIREKYYCTDPYCTDPKSKYSFQAFCEKIKIKFVSLSDLEKDKQEQVLNNNSINKNDFIDVAREIDNELKMMKSVHLDFSKSSDCFIIDSLPKITKEEIKEIKTDMKDDNKLPSFEYDLEKDKQEQVLNNNIINNKKENNKMKNNTIEKLVDKFTIDEIIYEKSKDKNKITWKDGVTTISDNCIKTTYAAYVHRAIDIIFTIKDVKFSADKVIVFWNDDTKTIVTIGEDEKTYDVEKALFAAYTKKLLTTINGNAKDRSLNHMIDKWSKVYEDNKKQIKADIAKIKKRKEKKLGKDIEDKKVEDKKKKVTKKTKKETTKSEKFYVSGANE